MLDGYKLAKLAHDEENDRIELARNDVRHNEIYQRVICWMHGNGWDTAKFEKRHLEAPKALADLCAMKLARSDEQTGIWKLTVAGEQIFWLLEEDAL